MSFELARDPVHLIRKMDVEETAEIIKGEAVFIECVDEIFAEFRSP